MNIHAGAVTREKPPFRAEHIGSLLRPKALLEKRERFARGQISQADLTAAEDAAISDAVALQERLGLRFATDGEFRRRSYHSFFYQQLGEVSIDTITGADAKGAPAGGGRGAQPVALVKSRVRWTRPINVADFNFLKNKTRLLPKITIPGPCALHFRGGDAAVLASAYRDAAQFWDDTVEAFTKELIALAEAGCRYVQIDETAFAKFGDPDVQAMLAARGDDWGWPFCYYDLTLKRKVLAPEYGGDARTPGRCATVVTPLTFSSSPTRTTMRGGRTRYRRTNVVIAT